MKNLYLLFVLVLTQTFLFADCPDGLDFDCDGICDIDDDTVGGVITLNFSNATETTIDINYNLTSCHGISGFQFHVDGVDLISATDGNLTVQTANNNLIAFDLGGAQLDPGSGSLASLFFFADLDGATIGLSNVVIGSSGSVQIATEGPGEAVIVACTNLDDDDLCDIDADDCVSDCAGECGGSTVIDECGICDGGNASLDCNYDCSGSLSAGTWVNTNPGGAVDPSAPTTVYGSADDGSWALSACVWLNSPSTVDNGDGTVTITSEYGSDAGHACELSSGVFNGEVITTNISTHDVSAGYAIVGDVAFTLSSANSSNFSVTSTGTFDNVGADYSLNGSLAGGSSGGAEEDCAGDCGGDAVLSGCDNLCNSTAVVDCADECGGDAVLSGCDNLCNSTLENDECGVCDGDNSSCADCAGVPNGEAELDDCGVCGGSDYFDEDGLLSNGSCNCEGNVFDCAGECGGFAASDCAGTCGGDAELDLCGECGGENTEWCVEINDGEDIEQNCPMDCEAGCELNIVLDGQAASADEEFDCEWSVGGSRESTLFPYNLTLSEGVHTYTLNCTNSSGGTASDEITIIINDDADLNVAPTFSLSENYDFEAVHSGNPDNDEAAILISADDVFDEDAYLLADDDQTLLYGWTQNSGLAIDGGPTFSGASLDVSASPGEYSFTLAVSDCYGASTSSFTLITVNDAPNEAPESVPSASASGASEEESDADFTQIFTPLHDGDADADEITITLSSDSSTDEDEEDTFIDFVWTGPEGLELVNPESCDDDGDEDLNDCATVSFVASNSNGSDDLGYIFNLTVTDSYGASHTQSLTVTLQDEPNEAPEIGEVLATTETLPHDGELGGSMDVELECPGSDNDADLLTYAWVFGGESHDSTSSIIVVSAPEGVTDYSCTVSDPYGASDSVSQTVTIHPEYNFTPVANDVVEIGNVPHNGWPDANSTVVNVCSDATDPDGEMDLLTYSWTLGGEEITSSNDSHLQACIEQELAVGVHEFTYTATDPYDESDSGTVTWTLEEPNNNPTADAGADQAHTLDHDGVPGGSMNISMDGSSSFDEDGDSLLTFTWCKYNDEDESCADISSGITLEDIAVDEGEHTFCLVVTDTYDAASDLSCFVAAILPEPNNAPEFGDTEDNLEYTIERDGNVETNTVDVNLCADAVDYDSNENGEKDEVSYSWSTTGNDDLGENENCITLMLQGELDGTFAGEDHDGDDVVYSYLISATDAYDSTSTLDFTITVHPETNVTPEAQTETYITVQPDHDGEPGGPALALITASNSFDLDGDDFSCAWSSGGLSFDGALVPGTQLSVDGANSCDFDLPVYHEVDGDNLYTLTLTVTDIYGGADSSDLTLEVFAEDNAAPVISSATCDAAEMDHDGSPGGSLSVSCSGSAMDADDLDYWDTTYSWCYETLGTDDVPSVEVCEPTGDFSFEVDDSYQGDITYRACDNYGDCGELTFRVNGVEPNQTPSADLAMPTTEQMTLIHDGSPGGLLEITLDGSGSADANPEDELTAILVYDNSLDVDTLSLDNLIVVREIDEDYSPFGVAISVFDGYGATSTPTEFVIITPSELNHAPVADAGDDINAQVPHDGIPGAGEACVSLDASGSTDNDGDDIVYEWRPVSDDRDIQVCLGEGVYTYELTITDSYGESDSDDMTITIQAESNVAPTISEFACTAGDAEHTGDPDTDTAEVTCVASASDADPYDHDLLSFEALQLSGDSVSLTELGDDNLTDEAGNISDFGFTFTAAPGDYGFSLIVSDPYGDIGSSDVDVTIGDADNAAPVIAIAEMAPIQVPHDNDSDTDTATFTIDACDTEDPDGDALSFSWSEANGPFSAEGCSVVDSLAAENYTYTLVVEDTYGAETSIEIEINIDDEDNEKPTANAGNDADETLPHDGTPGGCILYTLDASASQDLDSDDLTYTWSDNSSAWTQTGATVVLDPCLDADSESVSYSYTLDVCDGYSCDNDGVTISISAEANEPPAASIDPIDPIQLEVNCNADEAFGGFTLSSSSSDDDGDELSCRWSEDGGGYYDSGELSPDNCDVDIENRSARDYSFTLEVEDSYGASSSASITVTVLPEDHFNEPPVVDLGEDIHEELPHDGEQGGFIAVTIDPDIVDECLEELECEWSNVGGDYFSTSDCSITLDLEAGSYTYSLTVTDPYGLSGSAGVSVTVAAEDNTAPYEISAADQSGTLEHDGAPGGCDSFNFNATASDYDEEDELTYHFSSNGSLCEGTHSIEVYATDPYEASSETISFEFVVNPEPNEIPSATISGNQAEYQLVSDCEVGGAVTIDGISGSGTDDDDLYYLWTSCYEDLDIEDADTPNPILEDLEEGEYCLTLRVSDAYGDFGEASVQFAVTAGEDAVPVASAGDDQNLEIEHDGTPEDGIVGVSLDCGGSTDECDLSYVWTDEDDNILSATAQYITAEGEGVAEGEYTYTCTVTDIFGESSSAEVTVTATEPNEVVEDPTLTYSDDLEAAHETGLVSVTLDGCQTVDPDYPNVDPLTFDFVQIEDGEETDLDGLNDDGCSHTRDLEAGLYTFGLRVSDAYQDADEVQSNLATVIFEITYENQDPVVTLTDTPEDLEIPHDCDATGFINYVVSASVEELDGDLIISHKWTDNGDTACTAQVCNLSFTAGSHILVYTACDQFDACGSAETSFDVEQVNDDPTASASGDNSTVLEGGTICLDGTASSDECDLAYSWSLDGEELSSNSEDCLDAPMVDNNPGEDFEYVLTVTDVYGVSDSMSINVYVDNVNIAPVVTLGGGQEVQVEHDHDPGTTQYFLDTSTIIIMVSDDDSDELSYSWTVDGEEVSTDSQPGLLLDPGVRVIGCTVDDGYDGVAEDNISVFVLPEFNDVPVADAGPPLMEVIIDGGELVYLDGSGTTDSLDITDDGNYLTYDWQNVSQVSDGEDVNDYYIMDCPDTVGCGRFYAPALTTNSYVVMVAELTVSDPYSATDSDQITVVIMNENRAPEEYADGEGDRDNDIDIYPVDDCDPSIFECSYSLDATYTDPDHDNLQFDWYLDGELVLSDYKYYSPDGMISALDLEFSSVGDYLLEVVVTDIIPTGDYYDDPISVFKTWNLHVLPEGSDNIAPEVISLTNDNVEIEHDGNPETSEITLDLSVEATDENGHNLDYQWFLDGSAISDVMEESVFSYEVPDEGQYDFAVTVCDCYYTCTDLDIPILVNPETNEAPIAGAGEDQTIDLSGSWLCGDGDPCEFIYEGDVLLINALNSIDPNDDPMTYSWTQLSGPVVEFEYIDDSSISFVLPKPDDINNITLEFKLVANDSYTAESTDNIVITINSLYIENSTNMGYGGAWLVSSYAMPEARDIHSIFESLEDGNDGIAKVIGEGVAASYTQSNDEYIWIGSLEEIDPRSGYWVIGGGDAGILENFNLIGIPIDCTLDYNIRYGSNLLSYSGSDGITIANAFSDYSYNLTCEDTGFSPGLIAMGEAAVYDPELEIWYGSLQYLNHNDGYWFKSCRDFTFSWNCDGDIASRLSDTPKKQLERYPEGFEYVQSTEQAFYFIKDAQIDGEDLADEAWIIAYNNTVVVGARQWVGPYTDVPFMGYNNTDRTLGYGQAGDVPHFKVFIPSTGDLLDMNATEVRTWANNDLSFVEHVSATSAGSAIPNEIALGNAYPNPFNPSTTINFALPYDSEVSISIYNLQGREVISLLNGNMDAGYHTAVWNADSYSSGVYFVKMIVGEYVDIQKLILIK